MNEIYVDMGEYIGVLYDEQSNGIPVGMLGPDIRASVIAKAGAVWIEEGLEFAAKRRVVVAYRPDNITDPMEVDMVVSSDIEGVVDRYRLVKIEEDA